MLPPIPQCITHGTVSKSLQVQYCPRPRACPSKAKNNCLGSCARERRPPPAKEQEVTHRDLYQSEAKGATGQALHLEHRTGLPARRSWQGAE
jgi:hypothetical protein